VTRKLFFAAVALTMLVCAARAAEVVDEPMGARYSLGMTLWHMGRDPEMIGKFHDYLKAQNLGPADLLPQNRLQPPDRMRRILIEPELLQPKWLAGWKVQGNFLTSGATDAGPTVSLPFAVDRKGTYRLWVRFYAWDTGTAVTRLRIYPEARQQYAPIVDDEVYDRPVGKEGLHWKSILVDLDAGRYVLQLGHVTRWWHVKGLPGAHPYRLRRMDCIYLTDELWADAPADETLAAIRKGSPPQRVQWTSRPELPAAEHEAWKLWQLRPLPWEEATVNAKLFELGRAFWKAEIEKLKTQGYEENAVPDYRDPRRQVVFDETWNMVANPVRIARQVAELRSDIAKEDKGHTWNWVDGGSFSKIGGEWYKEGASLVGGYWDFAGAAETDLAVGRAGEWHVWVRFQNIGYHATWHMIVTEPSGGKIQFNRDKQHYPRDIVGRATWQKVGALTIPEDADKKLHVRVVRGRYTKPATYRRIYSVFATTDPDYVPRGTLRPPPTLAEYRKRAENCGVTVEDGYLLDAGGWAFSPLSHAWWPGKLETLSPTRQLTMARNTVRSVQVRMRNVREEPVTLEVDCGPLVGEKATFPGKVTWRVVGFVPYGATRQQWSPWCLLRRANVTIPPLSVAGLWLTVDNHGVPPGQYAAAVKLRGKGVPERTVTLKVRVSSVEPKPQQPVIVGGYTGPPESEEYIQDYSAHHMRMGWYNWLISKEQMQKLDIRLLILRTRGEANVRRMAQRAKALGLDYDDYVFTIRDEPTAATAEGLAPYINEAKIIRQVDPKLRICLNPGEAATLATFKILDPYCDVWQPYTHHRYYHPKEAAAKKAIFTAEPWLWYTTPCYQDKSPGIAAGTYSEIRSVPAQPGKCIGFTFFAFYYPFRDPWDAAYEHIGDVSVFVLPSRHGPVPTMAWEAIREAVEHADLARMVKERAKPDDKDAQALVGSGSVEALLAWLEKN